ncbi:transketolase [Chloroflexus aggregans]|uniref:Transketolase n=1 Tax=Chloroflexus aggregans (strain MD-66 / DSM 9485) TaxID=326427 RepID=B8GBF0_CHLAD|nr:transketolase [Chloroflexus aggregans]ACL24778.1 transketolase [Chloroflexus aggregans DSM 9485]
MDAPATSTIDQLCANAIRALAIDAVQQANSGHPGLPLGMADAAYVLWTRFLKHNPSDPHWPNRDRFVLSAGHGSMLLYALLHLTGYDLPLDELKRFRQWGSRTPGHPEYHETPGVEMTTGPLGQGIATAVGMAIAERWLATKFNRVGFPIVDHYTYVIASDGDLMEGISHEAASLAGHLRLGKLIVLYDSNDISLVGPTKLAWSENVAERFAAYGWQVLYADGHNMAAVALVLAEAIADSERPSLIITRTVIGYGSPRAGSHKAHGEPLGAEGVRLTKEALGWPTEPPFYVPDEVYDHMQLAVEIGEVRQREWEAMLKRYRAAYPDLALEWDLLQSGGLPTGWEAALPVFPPDPKAKGTRVASGAVLQALAPIIPGLLGGSADLHTSDFTYLEGLGSISGDNFNARNLHFGVREHAMGAILNGMALHGGIIPYGGTFLVFSDYMRPAIRLAALMKLRVIYVLTHDSIGVGEDGPTHQPVEHLVALRAIPNLLVVRPGDANEVAMAWRLALTRTDGPTAIILSRQNVPTLDRSRLGAADGVLRGGYVLRAADPAQAIIIATGSEVALALAAADQLATEGIAVQVVSMPCRELFDRQDHTYRDRVLPPSVKARVAVEAGRSLGWERYVGCEGAIIGVDRFGASAPFQRIYTEFGFTVEQIVATVKSQLSRHHQS